MARFLLGWSGMMDLTSASLASQFLEPLVHPWAVVGGGALDSGSAGLDALLQGSGLVLRLFSFLLSL